jgi:Fe-S-cluster containining protein
MKIQSRWLSIVFCALSLFTISSVVEASTVVYSSASNCRFVPEHWANGHRYPGRQVCSGPVTNEKPLYCKSIPGYWQNGYWHESHRVCRYR